MAAMEDRLITTIDTRITAMETKFTDQMTAMEIKFIDQMTAMEIKFTDQMTAMEIKFTDQMTAMDTKFTDQMRAMDTKFTDQMTAMDTKVTEIKEEVARLSSNFGIVHETVARLQASESTIAYRILSTGKNALEAKVKSDYLKKCP